MGCARYQRRAVVDDENHVVGIITELDLIVRNTRWRCALHRSAGLGAFRAAAGHAKSGLQHMLGTQAADIMTEKVETSGRTGRGRSGRIDGQAALQSGARRRRGGQSDRNCQPRRSGRHDAEQLE